jgi:hypothetical protein
MEVSDHLHAPATLPHRKEPSAPKEYEATWDPQPFQLLQNRGNLLPLPGITPFTSHPAHNLVIIQI